MAKCVYHSKRWDKAGTEVIWHVEFFVFPGFLTFSLISYRRYLRVANFSQTESLLEQFQYQLAEIDNSIKEHTEQINNTTTSIIQNEEKISKLIGTLWRVEDAVTSASWLTVAVRQSYQFHRDCSAVFFLVFITDAIMPTMCTASHFDWLSKCKNSIPTIYST